MKKINFIFLVIFCFIISFLVSYSQDTTLSTPLDPGQLVLNKLEIGLLIGINYPLSPAELTNTPKNSSLQVQKSLLNGLDGLGFKSTYDFGFFFRYPLMKNLNIGTDMSVTGWKSRISCNCTDSIWSSNNSLTTAGFALLIQYYFYDRFYVSPELSYNLFFAISTENDVSRGELDFTKIYSRIGAGIALGYEYPVNKKLSLDIFAKARVPNLLQKQSNQPNFTISESIINSGTNTNEATIVYLSLNLGIAFSFYYMY